MINPNSVKLKKILRLMPKDKSLKVLDLGCGKGEVTSWLYHNGYVNISGTDINKKSIEIARANERGIKFFVRDALKMDLGQYDVIIAWGVFEYILSLKKLFEKFEKEMKPRSILIFAVPNACSFSKRVRSIFGVNPNREKMPNLTFTFKEVKQIINPLKFKEKEIYSINVDCIKNFCFPMPGRLSNNIIVKMIKK